MVASYSGLASCFRQSALRWPQVIALAHTQCDEFDFHKSISRAVALDNTISTRILFWR